VAGSKRERDLARAKYERQQARRVAQSSQRRRRTQITAAAVVAVVVVGGFAALGIYLNHGSSNAAASNGSPSAKSTPSVSTTAVCSYRATATAARKVSLPPTSAPVTPAITTAVIYLDGKPVTVALKNSKAPCTVNSFTHLADAGYFNNTRCHRLTKGTLSVLQCGDPTGTGSGGPGYEFNDENLTGATYPAGTVAMANAGPNTNGSQFFLVYANSQLGPQYTPFGTIVGGMSVLTDIAKVGVAGGGTDGAPAHPVVLNRVTIKA
jgi:peptidyl-prolyl cis-trans isomerase B (cyclophilin B)